VRISGVTYRHPLANLTNGAGAAGGGGGGAGPTGKSYSFDGVDDYVLANGAAPTVDWDGSSSWSISTWFKDAGATATPLYIWSACGSVAATNRFMGISTFVSGGVPYVRFYALQPNALIENVKSPSGGGGYVQILATSPNGITPGDGAWHNVTLTVNTTASTAQGVKLYLDGVLAGYAQSSTFTLDFTHFAFGCRVQTNGTAIDSEFPGDIHQSSIYTSELTAAQVAAVYNNNRPVDETALTPAPAHFYKFGNGDTLFPTLKDYGSSPQDGTAYNMLPAAIVDGYPAGMSYEFDGVDDYIQADAVAATGDNFDWQTDAQTVAVWFKTSSAVQQALWSFSNNDNHEYYYLQIEGASGGDPAYFKAIGSAGSGSTLALFGKPDADTSPNGTNKEVWVNSTDTNGIDPTDGAWHHIVITYVGSGSTAQAVKLYVDGNYVGYSKSRSSPLNVKDFTIGTLRYDGGSRLEQYFSGNISQVSMWTSELGASDVTALYGLGNMPDPRTIGTPPQHLYRFGAGDNSFPTLVDYGSEGDNGAAVNMIAANVKDTSPP
jgi:hypothetical protein